jgi:YfiH family protein
MRLESTLLTSLGFRHAFPGRGATDPDVATWLGLSPGAAIVQVKQVHGGDAIEAFDAAGREADALIGRAARAGHAGRDGLEPVAVGIRTADCVPILLANETTGDVAAVHAGWRGVVRGIVPAAIARLLDRPDPSGGSHARLAAAIGPCIGPCCFEVGADVGAEIARATDGRVVSDHAGKTHVDLRAAVRLQLVRAGIDDARIEDVPGCTKHEPERFHSFRRDGANSGRMLAAIASSAGRR